MRLLAAADDNGSLKEISCIRGTDTSVQKAPQPEKIEAFHPEGITKRVQKLILVKPSNSEEKYLITAKANGDISIYNDIATFDLIDTLSGNLLDEKDNFVSLVESFGIVIAVTEQGKLTLIDLESIAKKDLKTTTTSLKAPISAFTPHPEQKGIYAFGGKENDVKIIKLFNAKQKDIFTKELKAEQLFQGKNVKNDKLDLRVPVWVSKILFVELSQHTETSWRFITITRYGQVRKYDTTHGKRPILDKKVSDKPLLCAAPTSNESEIICSDTHATTALFNINNGTLVAKFKGSVGAVQDLFPYLSEYEDLIVTGALDRYVRVFNIKTREQVAKVFVGSKVSAVWLLDPKDNAVEQLEQGDDSQEPKKKTKKFKRITDEEDDAIWDQLENTSSKKRKTIK